MVSSNIIGRSNVIKGAEDDDFSVAGGTPASEVQIARHTLDSQDVQGLTTPYELLPAPPAGRGYAILGVYSNKTGNAEYSDGSAVAITYGDASSTPIGTIPVAHFTATTADARWATRAALAGNPGSQVLPSAAVVMAASAVFRLDGADVGLQVRYIEVEL